MNKQALIKLAQVRLAINYVLRQRMVKQAEDDTMEIPDVWPNEYGGYVKQNKQPNPPYRSSFWPNFSTLREGALNYFFPWRNPNYVKPQFEYLKNRGELMHELASHSNNRMNRKETLEGIYASTPFGSLQASKPDSIIEGPDRGSGPDTPAYWSDLAHKASLPSWHPNYVSPNQISNIDAQFYDAYNGNNARQHSIDGQVTQGSQTSFTGLPMYPLEDVLYDYGKGSWWNTMNKRFNRGKEIPAGSVATAEPVWLGGSFDPND